MVIEPGARCETGDWQAPELAPHLQTVLQLHPIHRRSLCQSPGRLLQKGPPNTTDRSPSGCVREGLTGKLVMCSHWAQGALTDVGDQAVCE